MNSQGCRLYTYAPKLIFVMNLLEINEHKK